MQKSLKKNRVCEKYCLWNPRICTREKVKYSGLIIGDLVIIHEGIIEKTKIVPRKPLQ